MGHALRHLRRAAKDQSIVMEEFKVPSDDPGIELYVRNKHPQGVTKFAPGKILLYVHGATYPAETAFDLKLNGLSWMDYIAQHGYDVYLVDIRGYGRSTRPPEILTRSSNWCLHPLPCLPDFS